MATLSDLISRAVAAAPVTQPVVVPLVVPPIVIAGALGFYYFRNREEAERFGRGIGMNAELLAEAFGLHAIDRSPQGGAAGTDAPTVGGDTLTAEVQMLPMWAADP